MSTTPIQLSDALIERAAQRRGAGAIDPQLLGRVLAATATTRQVVAPGSILRSPRLAWRLVAVAAVVAIVAVSILAVGSGLLAPTPRPSASAPVTLTDVTPRPTAGPTTAVGGTITLGGCLPAGSVSTGGALQPVSPPDLALPAGLLAYGAFSTVAPSPGGSTRTDIWFVDDAGPTLVAQVVGPATLHAAVGDVAPSAQLLVVSLEDHATATGCDATFVVDTGTSELTQLTHDPAGDVISGPSLSADGRFVASGFGGAGGVESAIRVWDLGSDVPPTVLPCVNTLNRTWSPNGHRLATLCDRTLQVIDPTGSAASASVTFDIVKWQLLLWSAANQIIVANERPSNAAQFEWRTIIPPVAGATSFTARFSAPHVARLRLPQGLSVSPDGTRMALWSDGTSCCRDGYVVDIDTGAATRFARAVNPSEGIAWSSDGGSVAYVVTAAVEGRAASLVIVDLASGATRELPLPATNDFHWALR